MLTEIGIVPLNPNSKYLRVTTVGQLLDVPVALTLLDECFFASITLVLAQPELPVLQPVALQKYDILSTSIFTLAFGSAIPSKSSDGSDEVSRWSPADGTLQTVYRFTRCAQGYWAPSIYPDLSSVIPGSRGGG